jgi:hypothetical protein
MTGNAPAYFTKAFLNEFVTSCPTDRRSLVKARNASVASGKGVSRFDRDNALNEAEKGAKNPSQNENFLARRNGCSSTNIRIGATSGIDSAALRSSLATTLGRAPGRFLFFFFECLLAISPHLR